MTMRSVTSKHNHQTTLQYLSHFQHPGASNQSLTGKNRTISCPWKLLSQPGNDSLCQQARRGRFCPGALQGERTKGLGWQAPQGLSS